MNKKLHVENASANAAQEQLKQFFSRRGQLLDMKLVRKLAGQSLDYAFATLATDQRAKKVLTVLDGEMVKGRVITVSESRPLEEGQGTPGGAERIRRRSRRNRD